MAEASRRGASPDETAERAADRRRKLVREVVGLAVALLLIGAGWAWERAEPPDLRVTTFEPTTNPDPFSFATRDHAATEGPVGFVASVAGPERSRTGDVPYRFHLQRVAASDRLLVPERVVAMWNGTDGAGETRCDVATPGREASGSSAPVEVAPGGRSFRWTCALSFPTPPSYVDAAGESLWNVTFRVDFDGVRFLPIGFLPAGGTSAVLRVTTAVVYG